MNRKLGLRRYLRASLRDTWVLVREFRNSLLLFAGLLLLGGLILWRFYVSPETGQGLAFSQALYAVFTLTFFETTIPYPDGGPLQVFFFVVPILGLGVIAEGVIRFGVMLFNKQVRKGEWQVAVASTFRNHILQHLGPGCASLRCRRHPGRHLPLFLRRRYPAGCLRCR